MANNLRVFNTNSEYQSADLILPSVSYVVETDKVIYDMEAPVQNKWKATYSDSHVESAQCGSSMEIVAGEINLTNLVSIEIGDNCVTSIGLGAFDLCKSLTSCTIGNGVTSIDGSAFHNCTSLTSIDIPNSVTSIGVSAFDGCSSLTSCTIGSGVTYISGLAFANCSGLTSIDIPDSVTSIDGYAFRGCSGLTSVTIGDGVRNIDSKAFYESSGLTSVTIGSGITSIGENAFVGCRNLRSMTVKATTPPTLGRSALPIFLFSFNLYVPSQSVSAYENSNWRYFTSNIKPIP